MTTISGESNVVFVATLKLDDMRVVAGRLNGTVIGYFSAEDEIPPGWVPRGTEDITCIIEVNRLSKEAALTMMNKHWKS